MVARPAGRMSLVRVAPRKQSSGRSTRSSGKWKYGHATRIANWWRLLPVPLAAPSPCLEVRASLTGPAPGSRQSRTAVRNAARSSPCAAARHPLQASANLARPCKSSSSATSVSNSVGSEINVRGSIDFKLIVLQTVVLSSAAMRQHCACDRKACNKQSEVDRGRKAPE